MIYNFPVLIAIEEKDFKSAYDRLCKMLPSNCSWETMDIPIFDSNGNELNMQETQKEIFEYWDAKTKRSRKKI